jgi:hypothetical protein
MLDLFTWVLAASATLAPGRAHDAFAQAVVSATESEAPLFVDDADRKKTASLLVAVAFRESSLDLGALGDKRNGRATSFCAFQIHLPHDGERTRDGYTSDDLVSDPEKCVRAAMHMMRMSMRVCPAHPLAWYAEGPAGCGSRRGQAISRDRLAIAHRLVRMVKVDDDERNERVIETQVGENRFLMPSDCILCVSVRTGILSDCAASVTLPFARESASTMSCVS